MQSKYTVKNFLLFSVFVFMLALISLKQEYSKNVTEGIVLWYNCILPSLFPYMFIVGLIKGLNLTNGTSKFFQPLTKRLFNVNGQIGIAFLISFISGFPMGAKTVSDLYSEKLITEREAERASALCSSPSPSFLISVVGGSLFNSVNVGLLLLLTTLLSQITIGIIFSFYKRKEKYSMPRKTTVTKNENLLFDTVYSSVLSVLTVGGMITVFYLFLKITVSLKLLYPITYVLKNFFQNESLANGVTYGIIECTNGIITLSKSGITPLSLSLTAFLCGFNGISVIMQSIAFLKNAKIKTAVFLVSKPISAVVNFFICYLLCLIFL